ncbi:Fanconi anemia group J protein [Strongyloides ratti]|uniref:Fanconi anemia group J protein n=1 Tax=Strongyloides ratti TaxID=34506 RepID=A0A090LAV4_STRRB|nr:Fanconi anemia group J protein [Strongyloides ratti]CEF65228.1 Fanconi anemia group J protein [Strongyloides ratti]
MSRTHGNQQMITSFFKKKSEEDTVVNRKRARIKIKTDNNECRTLCISSINVEFPGFFNPYPSQELIMEANILSFIKSNNVLVESPTGSGKTMALLSSTIGWLVKYKKEFLTSIENCLQHGTNKSNKEEYCKSPQNKKIKSDEKKCSVDECLNYDNNILIKSFNEEEKNSIKCTCMNEIKIYYSTRTHKQIAQVIKELKRLPYCYGNSNNIVSIKHTILSAKEHTCINSEVKRSSNISERCKEIDLDKKTKCRFKMNLLKKFDLTIRSSIGLKTSPVWDIEELVHYGEMFRVCPHFAASTFLRNDANIIFCPFNYIVDPIIRDTANINLKNSIVILDEAHNIESFCRSSSSFDFTEKEIIHSLNDVYLKKCKLIKLIKRNSSIEFKKEEDDIEVSEFTISYLNKYLEELNCIIEFFKLFLNWFKSFSIEVLNEPSKTNIQGRIFRTSEIMRSLVISKLIRYKNDLVELNRLKNSWIGAMGFADEDKNDINNSITDTNEKLKKLKINTLSINFLFYRKIGYYV